MPKISKRKIQANQASINIQQQKKTINLSDNQLKSAVHLFNIMQYLKGPNKGNLLLPFLQNKALNIVNSSLYKVDQDSGLLIQNNQEFQKQIIQLEYSNSKKTTQVLQTDEYKIFASQDKYQEFCNVYAYYKQAELCNSKPNRQKLLQKCITAWKEVRKQNTSFIENKIHEYYNTIPLTIHSYQNFFLLHRTPTASIPTPTPTPTIQKHTSIPQNITTLRPIVNEFINTTTIQTNARSQQNTANKINSAIKNISECQQMVKITTDESLKVTLKTKIIEEQNILSEQRVLLSKLKRHAEAQSKLRTKKKNY
ncbi:unnamed protein product [Rhizophagus irregularis]|nr:unnamed protein product [Rhizophagus irregularis]